MTKLQTFLNTPISKLVRLARPMKTGDLFGLELECEGKNVDFDHADDDLVKDWTPHRDGSLRNHHGQACEWVFNGPVKLKRSVERVGKLFDYFEKRKAKLVPSNRTSTHIHYNMGDKNAYQLVNMFILFSIFEDILDGYCGDDRRGNLFCLSSRHAEEQLRWISDACFEFGHFGNIREDQRYCSFNFASINKFGTVEFRGMRGLDNRQDVLDWLDIIATFCEYASYTMKNPVEVVEKISLKGPAGFLQEVFGKDNAKKLTANLSDEQVNASVYEGMRLVQMLCYRIGTEFDQVRLRGKDFWASFSDDPEPDLDVDPGLLLAGAPAPRGLGDVLNAAGRGRVGRPMFPVRGNPANQLQAMEQARAALIRDEQARMMRDPRNNPFQQPIGWELPPIRDEDREF